MIAAPDDDLRALAREAGLAPEWRDAYGIDRQVSIEDLRLVLRALDVPSDTPNDVAESRRRLRDLRILPAEIKANHLLVVVAGDDFEVPGQGEPAYRIILESGARMQGRAQAGSQAGMLRIAAITEPGYHTLELGNDALRIANCPARCPAICRGAEDHARAWGVAAQVYSLHEAEQPCGTGQAGADPWSLGGTYRHLATLAQSAGGAGATALAISPLHAMFSADTGRYSPYSPSSRVFLNAAYIDPRQVFDDDTVRGALARADTCGHMAPPSGFTFPNAPFAQATGTPGLRRFDWPALTSRRLAVLRHLFDDFSQHPASRLLADWQQFQRAGGELLERHARYEALHAYHRERLGSAHGWRDWIPELRDPGSGAVARFAAEHRHAVDFHAFLQWLASRGLDQAQQAAIGSGMAVGLIADMAIGTDPRGSHAWSRQHEILTGVTVGAPPDIYQPLGQNWGLTAFSPLALIETGYAAFLETLRAAFAHAGGIRIDHVLGLRRMWLVGEGRCAADGAYLHYPERDMLLLVALEAWRHRAIVIGENLGTVPEGMNEALQARAIMGTSVLWFEREELSTGPDQPASFRPARSWPDWTMATSTTHDLPTIEGWWTGRDIDWRQALAQLSAEEAQQARALRTMDKQALWRALKLAPGEPPPQKPPRDAILAFVASTPSPLTIFPLEDLLGVVEQPNLPAAEPVIAGESLLAHPSWLQPLPAAVSAIFSDARTQRNVAAIKRARHVNQNGQSRN